MSDLENHLSKQKVPYIKDLVRIYKLKTKVNLTQKKADLIKDLDKHLELKDKKIKLKVNNIAKIVKIKPKSKTKEKVESKTQSVKRKKTTSTPPPTPTPSTPTPTPSTSKAIVPIGKVKTLIKTTMRKAKTQKKNVKMSGANIDRQKQQLKMLRRKLIILAKNIREDNQKLTDKDITMLDDYGRTIRNLGKNSIDDKIYMEIVRLRDIDKDEFDKDMAKNTIMSTDLVFIIQYNALKKLGIDKTINDIKMYLKKYKDRILKKLYTDEKIREDYNFFSN